MSAPILGIAKYPIIQIFECIAEDNIVLGGVPVFSNYCATLLGDFEKNFPSY